MRSLHGEDVEAIVDRINEFDIATAPTLVAL